MDPVEIFREASLTPEDAAAFAKAFQTCAQALGWTPCWDLGRRSLSHGIFQGFSTSHSTRLLYKGQDARPLILAISGRYYQDERPIIVRRSCCRSKYCLNPTHLYYGTKSDVSFENNQRQDKSKSNAVTRELVETLQMAKESGSSILAISRKYKVPYHTARRICNGETYSDSSVIISEKYLNFIQEQTLNNCLKICQENPHAARSVRLAYYTMEKTECPWHRPGSDKHKGNFGLMGECLDCMEEIRNGRCTVDVTEFSLDWYWTVKRFWDQVDIRGEDECWGWLGTTRRNNTESIAYFPSPFHSGKTQSAARVAFWTARGYTGKYKVFSRPECGPFCCNPKHLTIREFKDLLPPAKINRIRLKHDDIFAHARKSGLQMQPNPGK